VVSHEELIVPDNWEMVSNEDSGPSRAAAPTPALTAGPSVWRRDNFDDDSWEGSSSDNRKSPNKHSRRIRNQTRIPRPIRGHPNQFLTQPRHEGEGPPSKRPRLSFDEEEEDLYRGADDTDDSSIPSDDLDDLGGEWEIVETKEESFGTRMAAGEG
jgi:hypothetical protein